MDDLTFDYRYGFRVKENYVFKSRKGLDRKLVAEISYLKKEPKWMTKLRLEAYDNFVKKKCLPGVRIYRLLTLMIFIII